MVCIFLFSCWDSGWPVAIRKYSDVGSASGGRRNFVVTESKMGLYLKLLRSYYMISTPYMDIRRLNLPTKIMGRAMLKVNIDLEWFHTYPAGLFVRYSYVVSQFLTRLNT
jgi:hypothetical protein